MAKNTKVVGFYKDEFNRTKPITMTSSYGSRRSENPRTAEITADPLRFEEVTESAYLSKKLNNGDWDYWLYITVTDMQDAVGDEIPDSERYLVTVQAVSPTAAGKKNMDSALRSYNLEGKLTKRQKAVALADYGVSATLYSKQGPNEESLLNEAKKESQTIEGMFGFYMDKAENRLGNNDWDFISGNIGFGRR